MDTTLITKITTVLFKIILGGIINYGLNIGLTFLLSTIFDLYYLLAFALTQIILIAYSFIYNSKILFKESMSPLKLSKYLAVIIFVGAVNIIFVKLFTERVELYYLLSVAMTLAITLVLKYFLYWVFVFELKGKDRLEQWWLAQVKRFGSN